VARFFWVLERVVSGTVRGCIGELDDGVQDLPTITLLVMLLNSTSSTGIGPSLLVVSIVAAFVSQHL